MSCYPCPLWGLNTPPPPPPENKNILGASKIKLKEVNKKNSYSWKGNYFFKYLKASIDDLITLLSSSVQNSEGRSAGNGDDTVGAQSLYSAFASKLSKLYCLLKAFQQILSNGQKTADFRRY